MKKGKNALELLERIKINYKRRGFAHIFKLGSEFLFYKYIKPHKTFIFRGHSYPYLYHWYNTTWNNPRAVEIPIIWEVVKKCYGKRILEVGNVLSHYISFPHDIVDKYEKAFGVINEDVIDFKPTKKYDLIVSISTLEHVGFDESSRDARKFSYAIKNLKKCLNKDGKIVFTVPLGYNKGMEKCLANNKPPLSKYFFLKQISGKDNEWRKFHLNLQDLKKDNFHQDVILIGIIER